MGTHLSIFGLQALHSVILARMLGPVARGEYSTIVMYSQTLLYCGMLGGTFAIARRAGTDGTDAKSLGNVALRFGFTTGSACFFIVVLLAYFALPSDKAYLAPLCCAAALLLPFEQMRLALLSVDHGRNQFRRYNANRLIAATLFPVLLILAWMFGATRLPVIVCFVVATPALALTQLLFSHQEISPLGKGEPTVVQLARESAPYGMGYFSAQMLGRIDALLVMWLLSFEAQGHYMVALAASNLVLVIPNALSLFSFNRGVRESGEPDRRHLLSRLLLIFAIQVISALCLSVVLRPLVILVFREEFAGAVPMTLALLPGMVISGIAIVVEGYLRGRGFPLRAIVPRTLGTLTIVLASIPLVGFSPTLGIPIAASIGHTVSGIAILLVAFRSCFRRTAKPSE